MTLAALLAFAFAAGLIDAVVGGGGLVQIPALLILYPSLPTGVVLGTNKLAGLCGTTVAVRRFAGQIPFERRILLPAATVAFAGSFLGAKVATLLPSQVMKPLIVALLAAVLLFTIRRPGFGVSETAPRLRRHLSTAAAAVGFVLGFYDGFFGPGTGSFLIIAFIALFGMDFLGASARAKVINWATNLAAFLLFAFQGAVRYDLALPMAAANMAGAAVGSHLALTRGSGFVRNLFVVVVSLMILRLGWDLALGR